MCSVANMKRVTKILKEAASRKHEILEEIQNAPKKRLLSISR